MSLRSILVVLLALFFGGSAAVGINSLRSPTPPSASPPETIPVVVAAVDIPLYSTLSANMLTTRDFPKDMTPPGSLNRVEDAIDRVTLNPMVKDETVFEGKLAARGAGRGMAPGIADGMRAFTIQTPNVASGVAGFILPKNKVDVLLNVKNSTGGSITITLLQNVEILAVDQRVEAPADNKVDPNQLRSVTLLVTPKQALKLDLGQNQGTLHLSLRNPSDTVTAPSQRATMPDLGLDEELPGRAAAVPPKAPASPPPPIRIYMGAQQSWQG